MIKGFWYCTKERRDNLHTIVEGHSVCRCGYKKKLDARTTKDTKGEVGNSERVREQLRGSDVGTTQANGYRIASIKRDSMEFTHLLTKARSVFARG